MRVLIKESEPEIETLKTSICKHKWKPCLTQPDSGYQWYRCENCGCFGRPKRPTSWRYGKLKNDIIIPYRCSIPKCNKVAIERLHGRGPRCSYLWRCKDHADIK